MPQGWSKPRDLERLAEQRAQFEFEIPLAELPGIPAEFSFAAEPVRVWLQFGRDRGVAVADIRVQAELQPQCQRCLGAMRLPIEAVSRVAIVDSAAAAGRAPEELETFLAPDGHSSLAALAAEEMLLALPIVPRHADGQCHQAAGAVEHGPPGPPAAAAEGETQRPFADLRAMFERGKN
ncbi:MAG TPA: YceD family protein [Steroidobacteraceae bacterium]|nr:YceD family protein [Steroidobacteraceae bacterium]